MANPCCNNGTNGGTTTVSVSACCSIENDGPPSGATGVRFEYHSPTGAAAGAEIPVYDVDGVLPTTAITINTGTKLWISFLQVITAGAGEVKIYRGDDVSDDGHPNSTILRGTVAANGGIVANLDWIPVLPAEKLWVKAPGGAAVDVIGYGRMEPV